MYRNDTRLYPAGSGGLSCVVTVVGSDGPSGQRATWDPTWHPMAMRRDLMLTAATLLQHTEELVVATGILPIFEREPAVMAAGQCKIANALRQKVASSGNSCRKESR